MKDLELAHQKLKENKRFFSKLSNKERKTLDHYAHDAHTKVSNDFDCLTCANCCKTTGPLFTKADIDRLAKVFSMSSAVFITTYLRLDEDGDYVLQSTPCPFLQADNKCLVYDERPKACREFPHTDRKNFYQIRNLTLKNTLMCPIAFRVLEQVKINMQS
ncbi:YkgJ family cysteine cluster protein [Portibacter marinus]|uniref:YkgJ family cysteine cluster protein n=1 Tax=Portibacter marinus TaxID=2898660 RepID=UPI001F312628|nr:YkgJ family cysteine cluster protein [Portibacter marinus]